YRVARFIAVRFSDMPTCRTYTLSLHDALPIYQKLLCINGTKTRLCDGTGVSGWTITLTNNSGVVGTDITDENGDYSFCGLIPGEDRKSTRLNSSHVKISYAVFCLKKKKHNHNT